MMGWQQYLVPTIFVAENVFLKGRWGTFELVNDVGHTTQVTRDTAVDVARAYSFGEVDPLNFIFPNPLTDLQQHFCSTIT